MGFKQEAREAFEGLVTRVEALENLAWQLRGGQVSVIRTATSSPTDARSTLDYGAIAFGLTEIARKVGPMVGGSVNADDLAHEYKGIVQYFADVFAKADSTFDADEFARQAGA